MEDIEAVRRLLRENPLIAFSVYTHIQADITRGLGRDVARTLDAAFGQQTSVDGGAFNRAYGQFWLWVLAAYEVVRTMSQWKACFSDRFAAKLATFKKHVAELRIPFAKQEYAGRHGKPIEAEASVYSVDAGAKDIKFEVKGHIISARSLLAEFEDLVATVEPTDVLHRHGWSPEHEVS